MPSPFFRPSHSFRSIVYALLICVLVLIGIIVISNIASGRVFVLAETWQANLLAGKSDTMYDSEQIWTSEDIALNVELDKQKIPLTFGTQSEVLKLHLHSQGPYRLAYMSFFVNASGLKTDLLQNPESWTLYQLKRGKIDYLNPIGKGEVFKDGIIRLRLKQEGEDVYKGKAGTDSFVLSSIILKDAQAVKSEIEEVISFSITLPDSSQQANFPTDMDWSWAPGHEPSSWLSTSKKYGFADMMYSLEKQYSIYSNE